MIPVEPGGPVDNIARRLRGNMIGYDWALYLTAQAIGATDSWTPIVVLSEAVLRLMEAEK
jgi:hypothetical protein